MIETLLSKIEEEYEVAVMGYPRAEEVKERHDYEI